MFEKLQLIEERYEEINRRLMDPNVVSDQNAYRDLMKEYKNLTPIVEKFRAYKKAAEDLEEARIPPGRRRSGPRFQGASGGGIRFRQSLHGDLGRGDQNPPAPPGPQ